MASNLEEARAAAEEMFAENEQAEFTDEVTTEQPIDEVEEALSEEETQTEQQAENNAQLADAAQVAETAAMEAQRQNEQYQAVLTQMQTLQQQNQQLQGMVEEMSKRNEEQVVEEALTPPTFDIDSLSFQDEDTIREMQTKFTADMADYTRKQIMKEIAPFVEQAKEGMREKEKNEAISALSQMPELSGIGDAMPEINNLIAKNSILSSADVPIEDKIVMAYILMNGVNAMNTSPVEHKDPTVDELMGIYNNNSDFRDMVEKQRLSEIKNSQQVPLHSPSSGAVNAALNIKEKPKNLKEGSERARQRFGVI